MPSNSIRLLFAAATLAVLGCSGSCPEAHTRGTGPVDPDSDSRRADPVVVDGESTARIIAAAERFANATCACTSEGCADNATGDFVDWLRANPRRSGSPIAAKRVLVAMEKMLVCRDRLAYPDEPVDLEAGSAVGAASAAGG